MFSVWGLKVGLTSRRLTRYSSAIQGSIWLNDLESRGGVSASVEYFGTLRTYGNVEPIFEMGGAGRVDPTMDLGIKFKVGIKDLPLLSSIVSTVTQGEIEGEA
jgi:hypothetical protein